ARSEAIGEAYADGSRVTLAHDALGRLVTVADATGQYTFTYSGRGELLTAEAPQHPNGGILSYQYDAVGNQTLLHSWLGRQTMGYDALNRNTVMSDPDGNLTTWTFDARSLLTRQDNWNGTVTTIAYDPSGLTTGIRHTNSGGSVLAEAYYTWDE